MDLNLCLIWRPIIPRAKGVPHILSNLVTSFCLIHGLGGLPDLFYIFSTLSCSNFLSSYRKFLPSCHGSHGAYLPLRGLEVLSFGLEGGYLFSLILILLLSIVMIFFLGTLSYVSTFYFSFPSSSSSLDPSLTEV